MKLCITILLLEYIFSLIFTREFCLLCTHRREGQTQLHIFLRSISQSEIRNSAAESEGGQKFLPPNPLPFCPPERSVSAARSAAISQDFFQKRFELRSAIASSPSLILLLILLPMPGRLSRPRWSTQDSQLWILIRWWCCSSQRASCSFSAWLSKPGSKPSGHGSKLGLS